MARRYFSRSHSDGRETNFHETLSPTMGYRQVMTDERDTVRPFGLLETFISWMATIASILLAIRFVMELVAVPVTSGFANFTYTTTGGLTRPFTSLFGYGQPGGSSYFDIPALAAILAIALVSALLVRILQTSRR
jgi:hypothetical protein